MPASSASASASASAATAEAEATAGIHLLLIGIGTGNPEHLTLQAIAALTSADLVLIPRKGDDKSDLAEVRRAICGAHLGVAPLDVEPLDVEPLGVEPPGAPTQVVEFDMPVRDATSAPYLDGVNDWHDAIAATWAGLIATHRPQGGRVALLVWGDPSLYDSSLRIAERLKRLARRTGARDAPAMTVEVIPGLSTLQLLTAAHAIPLNTLAAPVLVTTGRHLREHGWLAGVDTLVVMLDGACAFRTLPPEGLHIYWAAYLGMPQQLLLDGPLAEIRERIVTARAAARAEHGWVMDAYLLRRGASA